MHLTESVSDFMEDGTVRQTQTYPNYIHVIELPDSVATRFGVKYDMTITNFQYYTPTEEQTECIVVVFNDPDINGSALMDTINSDVWKDLQANESK